MNLNFFPDMYNQSSPQNINAQNINQQQYNPYTFQNNLVNSLQRTQNELDKLSNSIYNKQPLTQSQPYYLFCGEKNDWDEFLRVNYGITEQDIFDDYKLFLQAKRELLDEQGQNKINTMKDKIKNKDVIIDATLKSNIKPDIPSEQFNRKFNSRDTIKSNNRPIKQNSNKNNSKNIEQEGV